jgi:hypothetical protein
LFITVPSEASSVSEVFYRFSTLTPTQEFGDQMIFSNCIEALEVLVGKLLFKFFTYLHINLLPT